MRAEILRSIQSDSTMRQRWNRYCRENNYADGIEFDDVLGVLFEIAKEGPMTI